jgi:hypothetical protein
MRIKISWGVAVVVALWLGLWAFILHLQQLFYQVSGPFYDSASYYAHLSHVLQIVQERGVWAALMEGWRGSTVALPWISGAVIGIFTQQPQLWMGPAIQAPWILSLMLSLYAYLRKVAGQTRLTAIAMILPFVINGGVLFYNRGWSDFSMDLMQYVLLGNALIFYLWTWDSHKRWPWVAAGVFFGLTCLFRSTAAVYIFLIALPIEIYRLWRMPSWQTLRNQLVMAIGCLLTCGWFYVANWQTLYNYYVVWNIDAQAHLPLREALRHWDFLWQMHIGQALWPLMWVWGGLRLGQGVLSYRWQVWRYVNWSILWCGLVPVGFLIVKGAGLNPFVCMPSIFGMILFALWPLRGVRPLPVWGGIVMTLLTLMALVPVVNKGIAEHRGGLSWSPRVPQIGATQALIDDAHKNKMTEVVLSVPFVGGFHKDVLEHLWIYQMGGKRASNGVEVEGITFEYRFLWIKSVKEGIIQGDISALKKEAKGVDYVFMQEEDSLADFSRIMYNPPENLWLDRLLDVWPEQDRQRVGGPWTISPHDRYGLWRIVR